jgi:hypothetical protein
MPLWTDRAIFTGYHHMVYTSSVSVQAGLMLALSAQAIEPLASIGPQSFAFYQEGVFGTVLVTSRTMRAICLEPTGVTSSDIFGYRNWLQMIRIDASAVRAFIAKLALVLLVACVVDGHAFGNWPDEIFVGPNVSADFAASVFEPSVVVRAKSPVVLPASIFKDLDVAHESLCIGFERILVVGHCDPPKITVVGSRCWKLRGPFLFYNEDCPKGAICK